MLGGQTDTSLITWLSLAHSTTLPLYHTHTHTCDYKTGCVVILPVTMLVGLCRI